MAKYNKYKFKKNPIIVFDFLKAKQQPQKSIKYFLKQTNTTIKNDFHVNQLAQQLHPYSQKVIVSKIIDHQNGIKSFIFKGNGQQLAYFRAGQYISVNLEIDGVKISRPYSIASNPEDVFTSNTYEIAVKYKEDGFFSKVLHNSIKINDELEISGPEGQLYYDSIRDQKHIVAIAGDIGITPFLAMARQINPEIKLTILYSAKYEKDFIYLNEIKILNKKPNIEFKLFTTQQTTNYTTNRRINLQDLEPYKTDATFFICGSQNLYETMANYLKQLKVLDKAIRYETNVNVILSNFNDYAPDVNAESINIKIKLWGQFYQIKAKLTDSILVAIQKAKIHTQSKCLNGKCSWCRIKLIKGKVYVIKTLDQRRQADIETNMYHGCVTYPLTDLEIEIY